MVIRCRVDTVTGLPERCRGKRGGRLPKSWTMLAATMMPFWTV
jgi:hypothetical protein